MNDYPAGYGLNNNGATTQKRSAITRAHNRDATQEWKCDRCGKRGAFKIVPVNGKQLCKECAASTDGAKDARDCFYGAFLSVLALEIKGRAIGERRLFALNWLRDSYLSDLQKYDPQLESIMPKAAPVLS